MHGPWPGPGPHGPLGELLRATYGVGAAIVAVVVALVVLAGIIAFLVILVRYLLTATKAAELYIAAQREAASVPLAPKAPAPAPAPAVIDRPESAPAPKQARAPRARAPRAPRTPPSA
ncbi:hypothetical protein [Pseudolysinimonas sp.]|uniref:hypothetical protein n=1 Tax=Pseudolysinimonas sp. TaxID=2680009 RepID=UPI003F7F7BBE